jgi:hypothetical protein
MRSRASAGSLALVLALPTISASCIPARPPSVAFDGCWTEGAPTGDIVQTAVNEIVGGRNPRIRVVAGVPAIVDSVRAHSELIADRSICIRVWRALDPEDRTARLAVVRVGGTYWVRRPHGYEAFDGDYRALMHIVDLD